MIKLKVIKLFNYAPAFDMYIVDFVREAGKTMAITISEDNKIEENKIGAILNLIIPSEKFIKNMN